MSPKLPVVKAKDVIRVVQKLGFEFVDNPEVMLSIIGRPIKRGL